MSQHRVRPRSPFARLAPLAAAGLSAMLGCSGAIGTGAPEPGDGPGTTTPDPAKPGGAPGGKTVGGPGGGGGTTTTPSPLPTMTGACASGPSLPRARVVRLTPIQIGNALKASFGIASASGAAATLPFDGVTDGFDTNARANYVSDRLAAGLRALAKSTAAAQAPTLLAATPCLGATTVTDECAGGFVAALGERAFRRPLDDDERTRFRALFQAQAKARGSADAIAATLETMLQSPRFLYRTELGAPGAAATGRVQLTPFEVASQLSFLVADAPPDAELMQAARAGQLGDRAVLAKQVKRLMKTPQARAKMSAFFSQYLKIGELAAGALPKDLTLFPEWTDALRKDLVAETTAFVETVFLAEGRPVTELFTAPYSYLNPRLMKHYGLPPGAETSSALKKVEVPAAMAGLLGRGAVMATLAHESTTSPVHRGVFVRETLLCSPPPAPPAGASNQTDLLNGSKADATGRERYALFQKNAPKECGTCHEFFQPLGLAFERFDAAGRPRQTEFGRPIDPSGTLLGAGDADGPFADGADLAARIAKSAFGQACFVSQYARYALGLGREEVDACFVEAATASFRQGQLTAESLLVAFTQSDAFHFRAPAGPDTQGAKTP